jgi:S1-C subfamily serine protease
VLPHSTGWRANLFEDFGTTLVSRSAKSSSRLARRKVYSTPSATVFCPGLEGEAEYIQVTTPVSEGSSGGGLFDDRGNLIGVTTFTVRDSQNLNFAIAASEFWR